MNIFCPQCKKDPSLYFRTRDLNRKISKEMFDYYRCQSCGLIFLWPIPDNLGDYYPKQYYTIPPSLQRLTAGAEGERYKIEIVQRFARHGRLLEIGPAYGSFALLAKNAGFQVEVIEMDGDCCKFLNEVAGIRAINSCDPAEALKDAGPYEVITLWHVIEHLADPWSTLKAMAERLQPGGLLVIAAPNPKAFQFRVLGRFWPHVDAPRHLSLIPLSLLQQETAALGLEAIWSTTSDKGTLGWNKFGWEVFLANFASRGFFRKYFGKIGRTIHKLVTPIERMDGLGSAYTVVFRKRK
jgi:2-polyprenyl-3-methyl-5-hydroxy-6-metoxy-1,4-benzoquinol methylase